MSLVYVFKFQHKNKTTEYNLMCGDYNHFKQHNKVFKTEVIFDSLKRFNRFKPLETLQVLMV